MQTQLRDRCPQTQAPCIIPRARGIAQNHWLNSKLHSCAAAYKIFTLFSWICTTLQSIKYLHGNLFLKILCFKYYVYTTADWESGGLGPGSQGCVTLGKSIHFSDYFMYKMRGKDCGVSEIFFTCNPGSSQTSSTQHTAILVCFARESLVMVSSQHREEHLAKWKKSIPVGTGVEYGIFLSSHKKSKSGKQTRQKRMRIQALEKGPSGG